MKKYDAIVIGAGHNGLTNAAYLAKAGLDVLVLEMNSYIGGATVSRELHKDWKYTNCSYVCGLLRPEINRDLELPRHGLQVVPYGGGVTFMENGDYYGNFSDHNRQHREMARHSVRDANAYERYGADVTKQTRLIRKFLLRTPPDPASWKMSDIKEMMVLAKTVMDMKTDVNFGDTLKYWTKSVGDFLDEYFESDIIKAHLGGTGIIGTALGVYSPGTAYVLLHHYMGDVDGTAGAWGFTRGGMGAVANALASSFKSFGGEIRTDAKVKQIMVRNGKTTGVALEDGTEFYADIVVSNLEAKRTFLGIMDEKDLPEYVIERAKNFKSRGSSGKVNIALDGLPTFPALPKGTPLMAGDFHFTDSLTRMEKAYDDWKDGNFSRDPYVDTLIPTLTDPTMAPPGKHMMTCFVQYCPPKIQGREWTDADRDAFGQTVIDQVANYSPDFKDLILHAEVRTPREIEAEIGLTEGNIFQGELTFDQLFSNRPFPGYGQYRGPVKGMYMCGSSTHPGGGVMAAPGANAAREILIDLKRNNTVPEGYADD
ncbi:NAD(P)/FAD-dependent oxidoreductase [Dasania sp. GY-MA-18]|uniref:Pyridine nucleotide-disulfide oxidoreductase domain-containing protein 2 n=1 Tax=Dasania phycosphaerae TaxID=2950436 RepID=A0A9J6RM49_9GAMM|nr:MULTISPECIES: NAD(P)/FAD-dependent oxidoreductase [Dasania]MCR8923163.1 NAD(P)/FAD-dependent oxidoreductase [Dasania sp. GY-MA-18]MCZ0865595.1 NAD(P)/FAD-dependent oxidoreductase [Dasania phycosphaerae]MCZ0869320.1 NAD(P)/FAD-dependent oxidoreductase [Dasania phycosphaerae]